MGLENGPGTREKLSPNQHFQIPTGCIFEGVTITHLQCDPATIPMTEVVGTAKILLVHLLACSDALRIQNLSKK